MKIDDILIITIHKGFWASPEAEIFPRRIYWKPFSSHSTSFNNTAALFFLSFFFVLLRRPKVILFGFAHRPLRWYILLRKLGFLKRTKIIATNQIYFRDDEGQYVDRILVYAHSDIEARDPAIRYRYQFIPISFDPPTGIDTTPANPPYIFSGGGTRRDFATLIEAMKALPDIPLKLVTWTRDSLGYEGEIPPNCELHWKMPLPDFLQMLGSSLFTVIPLEKHWQSHGQTTVIQAMSLGKPVITTREASLDDYVRHQVDGLLVEPGNVEDYQQAIRFLWDNREQLMEMQQAGIQTVQRSSYAAYAQNLLDVCLK
jgi:glycosyltransferase involved in cell wall biosynthesis